MQSGGALHTLLTDFVTDFHGPGEEALANLKRTLLEIVAPPDWRSETQVRIEPPFVLPNGSVVCWGLYDRNGSVARVGVIVDNNGLVHTIDE